MRHGATLSDESPELGDAGLAYPGEHMRVVIIIVGILQVLGGIAFFVGSKSAIHEILGSLTFGLGILSIALATVIGELQVMRRANETRAPIDTVRDRAPASGGLAIAPGKPMRWPEA